MMETYNLLTTASSPVLLTALKLHLNLDGTADDTILQQYIDATTAWGEMYTRRSFRVQTWSRVSEGFDVPLLIHRHYVTTVTSVSRLVDGVSTVVADTDYALMSKAQDAILYTVPGVSWPSDADDRPNAVTVLFTTDIAPKYAPLVKQAIMQHSAALYANRGDCGSEALGDAANASGAAAMYDMMRVARV